MAGIKDYLGAWSITPYDSGQFTTFLDRKHRELIGFRVIFGEGPGFVSGNTNFGIEVKLTQYDPACNAVTGVLHREKPPLYGAVHLTKSLGLGSVTGVFTVQTAKEQEPTALFVDMQKADFEDINFTVIDPINLGN